MANGLDGKADVISDGVEFCPRKGVTLGLTTWHQYRRIIGASDIPISMTLTIKEPRLERPRILGLEAGTKQPLARSDSGKTSRLST